MYLDRLDIPRAVLAAFPDYVGRKYRLTVRNDVPLVGTYREGGSKSDYVAVHLDTGNMTPACAGVESPFTAPRAASVTLPPRTVIVAHHVSCGKDCGLEIFIRSEDAAPMLPVSCDDLTPDHHVVLEYTRSLKPSHAGISDYRYHEARRERGISRAAWDLARSELIERRYLDRRGALTTKGRNVPRLARGHK